MSTLTIVTNASFHTFLGRAERRERKRIKKAIVQPKEITESDGTGEGNHLISNRKGKKEKTRKKPKIPTALALMHGFAATNVGKNRLTVGDCLLCFRVLLILDVTAQTGS